MMDTREQLRQDVAAGDLPQARRGRAQAAERAFRDRQAKSSGAVSVSVRGRVVQIGRVEHRDTADGGYADVWLVGSVAEPHYRIYNPPLLVEDPRGELTIYEGKEGAGRGRARRYRYDPVMAIAEAIAHHGRL